MSLTWECHLNKYMFNNNNNNCHLEWSKREKACHNGTCGNRDQNWWINHFCVHRRVHWSRGIGLCLILLIFNAVIGGYLQMRWSLWPTIFTEGLLQKASKQIRPPLIGPRPWRHTPRLIVMHVVFRSLLKIFKYAAKQACKQLQCNKAKLPEPASINELHIHRGLG